jgi:UDP-N-acetylmuramoylalanine--D-glutamate ligase
MRFDIGVFLNIDEDHLEHHKTMNVYVGAKEQLLRMSKQTIIVVNDMWTKAIAVNYPGPTLSLEKSASYWLKNDLLFYQDELQAKLPIMTGQHDVINAAVTWIVGRMCNIDAQIILDSLQSFKPLPYRQTFVRRIGQVDFINDSKATNIHAVIPSLQRFKGRPIYLILGGVPKFENLDALFPHMKDVVCVYGIGDASGLIERCLQSHFHFKPCQTLDKALQTILQDLDFSKPSVVLLAPACSSFDQYKNYEDRGEHFTTLVSALGDTYKTC